MAKKAKTKKSVKAVPEAENDSWIIRILGFLFALGIILILIDGWTVRENDLFAPKWDADISFLTQSVGYFLGLIGGSLMLLILLYPARKHLKSFNKMGPVKFWYRLHLIIGLSAPTMIILHANFLQARENRSISVNDRWTFYAMLAVVISGIIGRFFYRQVHGTLTQKHYSLDQMRKYMLDQRKIFDHHIHLTEKQMGLIDNFEDYLRKKTNFMVHLFSLPFIRLRANKMAKLLKKSIKQQLYTSDDAKKMTRREKNNLMRKYRHMIDSYFSVIRKVGNFAFYERLFSVWYLFHFPFYIVLIALAILHVVVVHSF